MTFDLQLTTLHHSSSSKPGKSQSCVKCTLGWNVTNHSSGQYRGKESKQRLGQAGVCGHPSRPVKVCFCFFLSHKIPFFGTREAKCFGMNSIYSFFFKSLFKLLDGWRDFDYLQVEANLISLRNNFHNGSDGRGGCCHRSQITALSTS
jgi:hypothetical protein